jgi:hypothetical protein
VITVLAFLPHGSARSRVDELRASARTRYELEALAVQKYEHDVLAYRVYLQMPALPPEVEEPEPRRSLAYPRR